MNNKKGQFYLIAALVIVSLAAGFIVVTNKASIVQNPSISYLKEEIRTESSNIINYGAYNGMSNNQIETMLANLSYYHINNSRKSNSYFLLGTKQQMTLIAYQYYWANVSLNGEQLNIGTKKIYTQNFSSPGNSINIKINNTSYNFNINEGENFHFIIKSLNNQQDYTISY